ncbi:MAG: hypothetical protein NC095_12240 [Muribaculum sp.]|nr:hypothetical protein [Muribaculum sp.]
MKSTKTESGGETIAKENSLEFMLNGGIRRLQRHGLKADGNYGKIDMVPNLS